MPSPKAMPMRAMPRDRPRSGVTSAIAALAVVMLPLMTPPSTRESAKSSNDPAHTHIRCDSTVPAMHAISTGRRPYRSDRPPKTGAKKNWSIE